MGEEREKGIREEEKKKEEGSREEEENLGLEIWNSCLEISYSCMDLLVRKPSYLSLCLCLGFEEPYLCIKVICVGFCSVLWLVLRWVSFGWKVSGKNGQNWPFL